MTVIKADFSDYSAASSNDPGTEKIIGVFYDVYKELGYGFLESVYREAMRIALLQAGCTVETEVPINVSFRGGVVGVFRADLIVNHSILLELKTADELCKAHESQTLNYLRATTIETALLLNFGPSPKIRRLVMKNASKQPPLSSKSTGISH
jgi:GxxExxY protein